MLLTIKRDLVVKGHDLPPHVHHLCLPIVYHAILDENQWMLAGRKNGGIFGELDILGEVCFRCRKVHNLAL